MNVRLPLNAKFFIAFLLVTLASSVFLVVGYPALKRIHHLSLSVEPRMEVVRRLFTLARSYHDLSISIDTFLEVGSKRSETKLQEAIRVIHEDSSRLIMFVLDGGVLIASIQKLEIFSSDINKNIADLIYLKHQRNSNYKTNKKLIAIFKSMDIIDQHLAIMIDENIAAAGKNVLIQENKIDRLLTNFLLIEVAIVLFGALIALFLARLIVSRILLLRDYTIDISSGDFSKTIEIDSSDEIGDLAFSLNSMNKQLSASIHQIHEETARREKAQEEKAVIERKLIHSQKLQSVGIMASGIAHNFNNILGSIRGYSEMTIRISNKDDRVYSFAEHIIIGTDRAKDMIKEMLDFSRDSDQELKPMRIHSIVRDAIDLFVVSMTQPIDVKKDINESCGLVLAEAGQLQQVILNLCNNAYQAMLETGGALEIGLYEINMDVNAGVVERKIHSNLTNKRYVCLSVKDEGCGMDDATKERIFEPFFTTKEVGKGTGLGLSSVHGIIKNHGGEIDVDSIVGKGTTFTLYFPLLHVNQHKEEC